MAQSNVIVGLDIGTTKILCLVAEVRGPGDVEIIGVSSYPSKGLQRGIVLNIDSTVESIRKAIEDAEKMAGTEITSVIVGIAGGHIRSLNGHGMITLRNREVTKRDLDRVIESATAGAQPADREVIHVMPQEFIVDGERKIKDPVGLYGVKLEAKIHMVTAQVTQAKNLVKCVHNSGVDVQSLVLEQIASSEAVLTPDERDVGVVLLDCGGGTTDIAVFSDGAIKYTSNITIGGDFLDNDISFGLGASKQIAKEIKERYGIASADLVDADDEIKIDKIAGSGRKKISQLELANIIEPRLEEIFTMARREIMRSGYHDMLPAGCVITGGSMAIKGADYLAQKILNMPVRLGVPNQITGLQELVSKPECATGVGLLIWGSNNEIASKGQKIRIREAEVFKRVFSSMKSWFSDLF
ncbi:MAG: cell division protein FtsA [Thermodesulfobacteriota bacterium]|jgi:cell division protein FtsA|nr:cell division protein FtsA [bacterium]MBT3849819.1 cell division protein FtsA [bacterium]MBT4435444.1 cell division protein FtsA [bacterium]MDG2445667.1 cell division protein FtsA [Thermodesulfobacteriota bacterium]RZP13826.1 MAG: cell division protein FtsA [Candidatus Dadabacteria bacterium]|tara:strand:+ start:1432 stop:2667 length:1236 start_codon:yes stop_codon:yes gene_type:complete